MSNSLCTPKKSLKRNSESLRTINKQIKPKQNPITNMSLTDRENEITSIYGKSIGGSGVVAMENTENTVMLQI